MTHARIPFGTSGLGRSVIIGAIALVGCSTSDRSAAPPASTDSSATATATADASLPLVADTLNPIVVTDTVPGDSDDPAIWVNPANAAQSFVVGTDKGDSTGGLYVFDLAGHIDRARSVHPLMRMNNGDVEYKLARLGGTTDIVVATERNRRMIRVFSLPDMKPIDGGGILVFDGDSTREPMGVSLYRRPRDGAIFAFVGGKSGPTDGTYIWQYRLTANAKGVVTGTKVRALGIYSGRKEIESIAVDDSLGYLYYSDEGVGVRQYYADPDSSTKELALFATTGVKEDHEGLAVYATGASTGYIVLSDQGANRIHVFAREGTASNPFDHRRLAVIPVRAQQTDGLEVTEHALDPRFPKGMLAMMSNRGAFHFYDWRDVDAAIKSAAKR